MNSIRVITTPTRSRRSNQQFSNEICSAIKGNMGSRTDGTQSSPPALSHRIVLTPVLHAALSLCLTRTHDLHAHDHALSGHLPVCLQQFTCPHQLSTDKAPPCRPNATCRLDTCLVLLLAYNTELLLPSTGKIHPTQNCAPYSTHTALVEPCSKATLSRPGPHRWHDSPRTCNSRAHPGSQHPFSQLTHSTPPPHPAGCPPRAPRY